MFQVLPKLINNRLGSYRSADKNMTSKRLKLCDFRFDIYTIETEADLMLYNR